MKVGTEACSISPKVFKKEINQACWIYCFLHESINIIILAMLPPEPFPRGKVEPHFIDTLVVLDDSMIKHHGRLLMPYTLTLMNTVSFIGDFCLPDTHECSCISLLAHPHTISDVINMLVDLFWCISDVHKIL